MAGPVQILLPILCIFITEAQLDRRFPFFSLPELEQLNRPTSDAVGPTPPIHNTHYNEESWESHVSHSGNGAPHKHHKHRPYQHYSNFGDGFNPFFGYGMNGFDQIPGMWQIPGINNVFNIPGNGYNPQNRPPPRPQDHDRPEEEHKPAENVDEEHHVDVEKHDDKPDEVMNEKERPQEDNEEHKANMEESEKPDQINPKPDDILPHPDKIDGDQHVVRSPSVMVNIEDLPPKTNKVVNDEPPKEDDKESDSKDDKSDVDLNKKKDYLLVGQGGNGNNVYLLHENVPNPNTVQPNAYQTGSNIMYVPYNPNQAQPTQTNQVYQLVPQTSQPQNFVKPDKIDVTDNAVANPASNNQNPGYVLVYSNGQLIQVPGVVVGQQQNVPVQNPNPVQTYVIANAVPNDNNQVVMNPTPTVLYACRNHVPNCGRGVVMPNPMAGNNAANVVPNNVNVLPNNVVYQQTPNIVVQPNGDANSYAQPNAGQPIVLTIATQGGDSNQNYQPSINGYTQPQVTNIGQGQGAPLQGAIYNTMQPTVGANDASNGYSQPIVTSLGQGQNAPVQGTVYTLQPAANDGSNGYAQPIMTNMGQGQPVITNLQPGQNVAVQGNYNQNMQPPSVVPANTDSNGYSQPMVNNQNGGYSQPIVNGQNSYQPNTGSNGYNQPMVTNMGSASNQGYIMQPMQNQPSGQTTVQMPLNTDSNGYSQPMVSNIEQGTTSNQGGYNMQPMENQPSGQPAVQMPLNTDSNGYSQPLVSNRDDENQNIGIQTAVQLPLDQSFDGSVPDVENRGDMTETVQPSVSVNTEQGSNVIVLNQPAPEPDNSLSFDSKELADLGAQPAVMLADFKDKDEKKDKKKNKHEGDKKKKDKGQKKKDKKKDGEKDKKKDKEPFINKVDK